VDRRLRCLKASAAATGERGGLQQAPAAPRALLVGGVAKPNRSA
jgi:hypothetical protein